MLSFGSLMELLPEIGDLPRLRTLSLVENGLPKLHQAFKLRMIWLWLAGMLSPLWQLGRPQSPIRLF